MASLAALAVATAILVAIPGPNVALIVANTLRYGLRMGVATVAGTTAGVALQLVFVVAGMAALVELAAEALSWIRWAGVVYLVWLGIRTWQEQPDDLGAVTAAPVMFWRGCFVAAVNPKTLLFSAAFLPQFVHAGGGIPGQLTVVAVVFLTVLVIGDLLWAAFAGSARSLLEKHAAARNRLTGGFLVAAGIGLALARHDAP